MTTDNTASLSVEVTSDATAAARQVDDLADAYTDLGRAVDRAANVADQASSKLDGVTSSAEGLSDTSSQATGALGALSSGFELVGLEQYATGLQNASMATDFLSGVGDTLTLVLGNQKVAQLASTAASKASTVATKAQTIAQRALNLAQSLNPIGLIVIAVIALIAGLVLLYKRSERFREIVQKVGDIGKKAIGAIVDVTSDLVGWIRDKVPPAFQRAKDLIVRYVDLVTTPYRKLFQLIKDVASFVREKLPPAFSAAKDLIVSAFDRITAPIQAVIDLIQKVIDKISNIDLGIVGDIAGGLGGLLGRQSTGNLGGRAALLDMQGRRSVPVTIIERLEVNGFVGNEADLAYRLDSLFGRRRSALGVTG